MRTNGLPRRLGPWAIAATILMVTAAGCGTTPQGPVPSATTAAASNSPSMKASAEPQPAAPNNVADDVPTNVPQPIPQPDAPPDPSKDINIRAVANTVNANPLSLLNPNIPSQIAVYVTVTWSKVPGAAQYRVSRNDDSGDKFYIRANVPGSYTGYHDGGPTNLKIDNQYQYIVEALDSSGTVIAKSKPDSCKPLYPLDIPKPSSPADGADSVGISPQFQWDGATGANGYYIEVFSGVYFVPMWRGFRKDDGQKTASAIQYGNQVDMMAGTYPNLWAAVLNPAGTYLWCVTAVKTDTGNALTAKAWSKSNSLPIRFYCGKKPASGVQNGGN
jgi:hypothetical protein